MTDPNTTTKPTGLALITSTLNRGSTGDQVKALQQYLIGLGYNNVKADGVFGPITEAAVKQFQADNGLTADGHFGPNTLGAAKKIGSSSTTSGEAGKGNILPTTQAEADALQAKLNAAVAEHPEFKGNSKEALDYAISTGDFSNIVDSTGKPFSSADQAAAFKTSQEALAPGFEIAKTKETADTVADLAQKKIDHEKWLADQGDQFQEDKSTLDQNAADKGVLFSGGRVQKEKKLGDVYSSNQAYKEATAGNAIANTARDYQSKYGDTAAGGLSRYYNLSSNTYNPNVATGGVKGGGLSNFYNPSGLGYQGTKNVENTAAAEARAAGLLWNKANKLVGSGINNQYKK